MSVFQHRAITCPGCGRNRVESVIVSLNGARTPRVVERIRRNDFQRFVCEGCGVEVVAEGPFIYTDFAAKRWVGVFPSAWEGSWRGLEHMADDSHRRAMIDHAPPIVRQMADGFAIRTVFGLPALAEKIVCWDRGLDDRLVELLKLDMARHPGGPALDPVRRPRLLEASPERLVFDGGGLLPGDDSAGRLAVPRSWLTAIEKDAASWDDALDLIAAGPYVDIGRAWIAGDEPSRWAGARSVVPFGKLSGEPTVTT